MATEVDLLVLETRGWEALSSSPEAARAHYDAILAEEPEMLLPGGLRLTDREQILAAMSGAPWAWFEISDARSIRLSDASQALAYRATAQRNDAEPYRALICSTYALQNGQWKLVIHQQTPV